MHVTESPAQTREVARVVLPSTVAAAASARVLIGDVAAVYDLNAYPLKMVASELVANAVVHAADSDEVELAVALTPEFVIVEVVDSMPKVVPDLTDLALPDDRAERGRGLVILALVYEARLAVYPLRDGTSKGVSATLSRVSLAACA